MSEADLDRSEQLLDLPAIRRELCDLAMTEEGRGLIMRQPVLRDRDEVERLLDLAGAWRALLEEGIAPPALQFPPSAHLLAPLRKEGGVAEATELASIGLYLDSAAKLKGYLQRALARKGSSRGLGTPEAALSAFVEPMPDLGALAQRILAVLEPDGALREERIPALKAIRRQTLAVRSEIAELSSRHMNEDRQLWQADVPTQKDGRTVLPLKAGFKGRIDGIVHDLSGSGATLFIEPYDLVDKNNELARLDNRYRQEVLRILRELSEAVRTAGPEVEELYRAIAALDAIYVRARYAIHHRCTRPEARGEGMSLRQARHPLLGPAAVPVDIELTGEARVLIISGPNTGGKTVALKCAGLLALMHQLGMEIPVADGSSLPIFDAVHADIGDEQSIANSLSTFSAHVRNIARIMSRSTSRSLVLLDEVGSDTDPSEGAALAMALLDRLRAIGALTVATTHYGVLKNYGLATEGVVNGSVSFDETTLAPTYRLVLGVPGESHALEIAERNGIDPATVERARGYVDRGSTELSRAIRELAALRREATERVDALEEAQRHLRHEQERVAEREAALRRREIAIKEGELSDLGRYLGESRRMLENLVRSLREGELTRDKTRAVKEFLGELAGQQEEGERALAEQKRSAEETSVTVQGSRAASGSPERSSRPAAGGRITEGIEVLVGTQRRLGTVIRKARGTSWVVAVKTVRLTVPESELVPAGQPSEPRLSVAIAEASPTDRPVSELDVRGMRLEEAIMTVERQLDRALLAGLAEFSIIHGMGEGILQEGIHRYLRGRAEVGDFFFARPEAGGFGKTIVLLGTPSRPE